MDKVRIEIEFEVADADYFESWIARSKGGVYLADSEYFLRTLKAGRVISVIKEKDNE